MDKLEVADDEILESLCKELMATFISYGYDIEDVRAVCLVHYLASCKKMGENKGQIVAEVCRTLRALEE